MTQTESKLSAIFAHCEAVKAGIKKPLPPRQAQEQVRLFLGLKRNNQALPEAGRNQAKTR